MTGADRRGSGPAWRLGTVPYLNAAPLTAAFERPDALNLRSEEVNLQAAVPALLLTELLKGEYDAALVSIGGVLSHPELLILPHWGIVSDGPVESIQLYCRAPASQVRRVALDSSSRSAVALARVLLAEYWGVDVEFTTMAPHLGQMLEQADAALLIGNPALIANERIARGEGPEIRETHDLGERWRELTGLPFVYAAWTVPEPMLGEPERLETLQQLLSDAARWGMDHRAELAAAGARSLDLPFKTTERYLTRSIQYSLGPRELEGIRRFCDLALRHGVLPPASRLRAVPRSQAAALNCP